MKKLLCLAACVAAMWCAGAQCEGLTKKGERCKREAADGSAYCLGHADQAPAAKAKGEKPKDDGQCWAITEAGTRCKRKKDGASDYCKQHAPDVAPKKPVAQCRAMTWEGKPCPRKPEEGRRYCKQHGKM